MSVSVDIEKQLGSFCLRVCFEAGDEVLSLLGASGCGKSLTLKCIAGIEKPDRGRIVVDGVVLFDSQEHINLSPQQRRTGLLFQNYALFPNMTVEQNIRAGARREKSAAQRERMMRQIMESFGLRELARRYPHQLSGGQQQRAALARILVSSPRILLLDEPFSALDSHLRFRLEREVRGVLRQFGKTVILVSHDRDEVFRISDRIAVMHNGGIEVCGPKKEVFANPRTRSGAMLTGCKNISRIERLDAAHVRALDWEIELEVSGDVAHAAYVGVRMHDICSGPGKNSLVCEVAEEIENPFSYTVMLRPAGSGTAALIGWEMEKHIWQRLRAERVTIHIPPDAAVLLRG